MPTRPTTPIDCEACWQNKAAVIPSIARREPLIPHDREAYRRRDLMNACSLTSKIAELTSNFLAGVVLAATIIWWV